MSRKISTIGNLADPTDPYFVDADSIAIPLEGVVHCPHCNRSWAARLTPVLSRVQCRDMISRLLDRLAVSLGHAEGIEGIRKKMQADWLAHRRKSNPGQLVGDMERKRRGN